MTTTIDEQTSAIQVLSRAPVTLPGETGLIPVTVANDLDPDVETADAHITSELVYAAQRWSLEEATEAMAAKARTIGPGLRFSCSMRSLRRMAERTMWAPI